MAQAVQYLHPTTRKRWHCLRPDRLSEALANIVPAEHLPALHGALESAGGVMWTAARRWFEMQPMVAPATYDALDLHSFPTADELESSLGLKRGGLRQEIAAMLGVWNAARPKVDEVKRVAEQAKAAKAESFTGELPLATPDDPDKIITAAGFASVFAGEASKQLSDEELLVEKQWLASRIQAWRRPLGDPQVASLAQTILVKEVLMRRTQARLLATDIKTAGKETAEFMRQLNVEQAAYADLITKLDELAPWMNAVSGRVTLQGVVADIIRILQEYGVTKETALIDGFFSATEIQVLLNTSQQMPDPQYRPDIVVMVAEAKAHLWNRDWSDSLTPSQYRRLRTAWTAAERECRQNLTQEESDRVPDFMDEGPGGEYPDLVQPPAAGLPTT